MRKPSDYDEVPEKDHYRISFLSYYRYSDGMNKKKISYGGSVYATSREEAVRIYCLKKNLHSHDIFKWADGSYKETFIIAEKL